MSYDIVRDGISGILKAQGLTESLSVGDFKNASVNEYENTFILMCLSGEGNEPDSETIVNKVYDNQLWSVQVAFPNSAQNDLANYDAINRIKDTLIKKIDDPASWSSYVRIQKYKKWNIKTIENYFILEIEIKIIDTYTY